MERLIFHIDVNSAFLSWESARRVKQGLQDLRDIPACIGGDPILNFISNVPGRLKKSVHRMRL